MAGSHHFGQRLASPDAGKAQSGEDPHEHWRLTTSPDQEPKIGPGRGHAARRADLPDLRVLCPPPAPDLGGRLRLLWGEAVAVRGPEAHFLRLSPVSGDLAGEAGGGPRGR